VEGLRMIKNLDGKRIVRKLMEVIQENKDWLSEIDGAIGDGDHGVNMAKGFSMAGEKIDSTENNLSEQFKMLAMTLVSNIGGAMGPIYGTFFLNMSKEIRGKDQLEAQDLAKMLRSALEGVKKRGGAKVGDKTLVDTLEPATIAYERAIGEGKSISEAIDLMIDAAKKGMESTKELVAKKGRSSRLGERSKGTIDAGSASCYLILKTLGESFKEYCE